MAVFTILLTVGLSVLYTHGGSVTDAQCVCNPTLQVNGGNCEGKGSGPGPKTVTVTTVMQENAVKKIFENVSNALLQDSQIRFSNFLQILDFNTLPKDCQDILLMSQVSSGRYIIYPDGTNGFPVYCDMDTDEGGWTVIQRRVNGSTDFYRTWNEYMFGFGDPKHEFWLGNEQIHSMVSKGWNELRIDMIGPNDERRYATYDKFSIGDISTNYKLSIYGYHGDAGDHMLYMNGMSFTTKDRDNDIWNKNCAVEFTGAWWYTECHNSNLNGIYGETTYAKGITWTTLTKYNSSLKWVDMKIRRWRRR